MNKPTSTSAYDRKRTPVSDAALEESYVAMAADDDREAEAEAWCDGLASDVSPSV